MIKAALLQLKVGLVGGYKHTKMGSEAKGHQNSFYSSKKFFHTLIQSTGLPSSGIRSALCEPGRVGTSPLHLNGFAEPFSLEEEPVAVPRLEQQGYNMASKGCSKSVCGEVFNSVRGCPLKWTNDTSLTPNSWSKHIKPDSTPYLPTNHLSFRCMFMVSSQQPDSASSTKQPRLTDSGEMVLHEAKVHVSPAEEAAMEQECILSHSVNAAMESMSKVNISSEGCHSKVGQGLTCEPSTGSQPVDGLSRCPLDCVVLQQGFRVPQSHNNSSPCANGFHPTHQDGVAADEDGQFECMAQKARPKKETCSKSDDSSPVTAKSMCDRKKKRKKHSSKKRRRHKGESSSKCEVKSSQDKSSCKDEELFCGDNSDKDIVTLTTDCDSSKPGPSKSSSPLAVSKCSFFLNPAELSDGDHSDSWHDELEPSMSLCQDSDSLLDEFSIFSPFMVCPRDQASSVNSSEEERYENLSESDEGVLSFDMEVKRMLDEANSKWQASYGDVHLDDISLSTKVQFPSEESNLYTVFVLSPDEVDAYREARIGKWEEFARDRQRFNDRITRTEKDIGYCLQPDHRAKIFKQLYDQHSVI